MKKHTLIKRSLVTNLPMKVCNSCGSDTVVYSVIDNAPICRDCLPLENQSIKKIPSESKMIQSVLNNLKKDEKK